MTLTSKRAVLPASARFLIIGREGRLDLALLTRLGAHQAFLEARDEIAAAEQDGRVLGRAAREGLAVDLADEVDDQTVAFLGRALLRLVAKIGGAEPVDRLVDIRRRSPLRPGFSRAILPKSIVSILGMTSKDSV